MGNIRYNCSDCETYRAWKEAEELWEKRLIIPPAKGSGIDENYCYCETCGMVVDLRATPEDNCCTDFEEARWSL